MTNRRSFIKQLGAIGISSIGVGLLSSCEDLFEYSPYSSKVDSKYKETTLKNLGLLNSQKNKNGYKFAIIGDSHYFYTKLDDVVKHINKRDDIDFVIHAGDLTDGGLLKEYEMFYRIMNRSRSPFFTAIGNHDYRSNGLQIYEQMFGNPNFSFEFNSSKFVFFDSVHWESNEEPKLDWLENELSDSASYKKVFVITHIPPNTDQFTEETQKRYSEILSKNNVAMSIHGHIHSFTHNHIYNDGVDYLTVDWVKKKGYNIVTVNEDFNIDVERVKM